MSNPIPTEAELVAAIDNLFYAAHQSAIFVYWTMVRQPLLRTLKEHDIAEAEIHFSNAILESSLDRLPKIISETPHKRLVRSF